MKKFSFYSFIILLVLIFSCSKKNEETKPFRKDITELVFASGSLEASDKYNLTAQSEGYIVQLNFDENQNVSPSQLLAVIDNKTNAISTEAASEQAKIANENVQNSAPQLQQIQANLNFAKSKLQQDQLQAQRYKRLYESNSIAKLEYENMLLNVKNSQANLNALQQQYNTTKQQATQQQISQNATYKINASNLSYNNVRAITSGKVLKKYKQKGDYVKRGEIIATIGSLGSIEVILNVDENSIGKIQVGQEVYVQLNTDKTKTIKGKVREISPQFDETTQSFITKVALEKIPNFAVTGTQLEANIMVGEKKNALLIPRSFLGFGNKVKVKGKEEPILVKTGILSTEYVEILEGISENDIIEKIVH